MNSDIFPCEACSDGVTTTPQSWALKGSFMSVETYNVVVLGESGSGKTVLLASLFKRLSTVGNLGFMLQTDPQSRKKLLDAYSEIADPDQDWPRGTRATTAHTFTCFARSPGGANVEACKFRYHDYAGGNLTDDGVDDQDLLKAIDESASIIVLLDGRKVLEFMQGLASGRSWALRALPNLLAVVEHKGAACPVQFVITKWDLLAHAYGLADVRDRLHEVQDFENVIAGRERSRIPIRLLPVSAVGRGFCAPAEDDPRVMRKIHGRTPHPEGIDATIAAALLDSVRANLEAARSKAEAEAKRSPPPPGNAGFFAWLLGVAVRVAKPFVPTKFRTVAEILERIAEHTAERINQGNEERAAAFEAEKRAAMAAVHDSATALAAVMASLAACLDVTERDFPGSRLTSGTIAG